MRLLVLLVISDQAMGVYISVAFILHRRLVILRVISHQAMGVYISIGFMFHLSVSISALLEICFKTALPYLSRILFWIPLTWYYLNGWLVFLAESLLYKDTSLRFWMSEPQSLIIGLPPCVVVHTDEQRTCHRSAPPSHRWKKFTPPGTEHSVSAGTSVNRAPTCALSWSDDPTLGYSKDASSRHFEDSFLE